MKKKLLLLGLFGLGLLSGCAVKQKGLPVKPLKDIKDEKDAEKLGSNLDNSLNLLDELYTTSSSYTNEDVKNFF